MEDKNSGQNEKLKLLNVKKWVGGMGVALVCALAMMVGKGIPSAAVVLRKPVHGVSSTLTEYKNSSYGFKIGYPAALLTPGPPATDGRGRSFTSHDSDVRLTCWSAALLRGQNIRSLYRRDLAMHPNTTYKAIRPSWYVLSGKKSDGKIFYEKVIVRNTSYIAFIFEYDDSMKRTYDPILESVAKSFGYLDNPPEIAIRNPEAQSPRAAAGLAPGNSVDFSPAHTIYRGMYIGEPIAGINKRSDSCFSVPDIDGVLTALVRQNRFEACMLTSNGDRLNKIIDFVAGSESQIYGLLVAQFGNPLPGQYRMLDSEDVPTWYIWKEKDGTVIGAKRDHASYLHQEPVFFTEIVVFKR